VAKLWTAVLCALVALSRVEDKVNDKE